LDCSIVFHIAVCPIPRGCVCSLSSAHEALLGLPLGHLFLPLFNFRSNPKVYLSSIVFHSLLQVVVLGEEWKEISGLSMIKRTPQFYIDTPAKFRRNKIKL
jgi:hypothetical protein